MCGIIGIFGKENAYELVKNGLTIMKERGRDGYGFFDGKNTVKDIALEKISKINNSKNIIGHCLHAIVKNVKQPITSNNKNSNATIVINCEIYNWKELTKKYDLICENDSELALKLIQKIGLEKSINLFDGPYALAYWEDDKVYLSRDLIGEKPLFISKDETKKTFAFASEKKALIKQGFENVEELNPRTIIKYNIQTGKLNESRLDFFEITPEHLKNVEEIKKETLGLIINSIAKRVPDQKVGLLFSGGIDSVVIAKTLKDLGVDFTCYTAGLKDVGLKNSDDIIWAKKAAKLFGFKLKVITINLLQVEEYIKKVIPLIEDANVIKVGVSLPFYIACEAAKKDKVKVIFSGLGSEEIFAGYKRHERSHEINKECLHGLLQLRERDLYRDDVITMANNIELRLPYLDKALVDYALKIPSKYKINEKEKKIILREISEQELKIPHDFAWRPKKAAQYGSGFDKAIEKLTRKKGFEFKADYMKTFFDNNPNRNLGALFSSGKDSTYAIFLMKKHNNNIKCLITLKSENKDSFMFHTPNIDLASLQAESMNIPLIEHFTKGQKEDELQDLKDAIQKAKDKYKIQGIITGALYSNYQRERIEKVCDELGLPVYSPLWHKDQETEMKELLNCGFEFMFSSVAAEGLDKKWLGRIITFKDIEKLVELNKKYGINIAGEGGEFESLVIDCPLFSKKLKIFDYKIVEDGAHAAKMIVNKAELIEK